MLKRFLAKAIRGGRLGGCSGGFGSPTVSFTATQEGLWVKYDDHKILTKSFADMLVKSVLNTTLHCRYCGSLASSATVMNKAQHHVGCDFLDVINVLEVFKSEEYEWFDAMKRPPQFNERVRVKREDGEIDEDTLIVTGVRSMDFRKSHQNGKAFVTHWSEL